MANNGMSEMFNRAQSFINSMSDEEFADWFKTQGLVEDYLAIPDTISDSAVVQVTMPVATEDLDSPSRKWVYHSMTKERVSIEKPVEGSIVKIFDYEKPNMFLLAACV